MASLRQTAAIGVKWMSASMMGTTAIDFVRVAILAHLLSPADFGLVGMIMVVTGLAQNFADFGISSAIIQKQDTTRDQLSSLYWLNIFAGIIIFVLIMVSAPLVVKFYNEPRLTGILYLSAVSFLIAPIGQQFQILLQKELKFDTLAKVEFLSSLLGMFVSITLAYLGYGVYSLVWGGLSGLTLQTLVFAGVGWRTWRPAFRLRLADLKGYVMFGLYQMGQRSAGYFSYNVDYLCVGRFLGPSILGVYIVAYQLVVKPVMKINPILTRVAFPIFSKKQEDNLALRTGYLELIKVLSFVVFPLLVGLAVTAPVFISVVYGKGWELSVPLIQIMVLLGIIWTLQHPAAQVFLAKGRADICFKMDFAMAIANTVVFWFAAQKGVFFVAWSWIVLISLYFALNMWIFRKIVGISAKEYVYSVIKQVIFSMLMGISVFASYLILKGFELNQIALLAGLIIFGMIIYVSLVLIFEREYARNLWGLTFPKKEQAV